MSDLLPMEAIVMITLAVGLVVGFGLGWCAKNDCVRYNGQRAAAERASRAGRMVGGPIVV